MVRDVSVGLHLLISLYGYLSFMTCFYQFWECSYESSLLNFTPIPLHMLTLRLLMSYIYMEHLFLMFLDHTQRRNTVGRTPLDE
jgi:hypothetical protein